MHPVHDRFSAVGSTAPEHANYHGGYIVGTHGSRTGGTLDAIQLELGSRLRASAALAETAEKLTTAIAAYADSYLPRD